MKLEEEKLWSQMEFARFEHETEFMKEQIRVREEERMRRIEMVSAKGTGLQTKGGRRWNGNNRIRETMFDFINNSRDQSGMSGMMAAAMGQSVMENIDGSKWRYGADDGAGMGLPAMTR